MGGELDVEISVLRHQRVHKPRGIPATPLQQHIEAGKACQYGVELVHEHLVRRLQDVVDIEVTSLDHEECPLILESAEQLPAEIDMEREPVRSRAHPHGLDTIVLQLPDQLPGAREFARLVGHHGPDAVEARALLQLPREHPVPVHGIVLFCRRVCDECAVYSRPLHLIEEDFSLVLRFHVFRAPHSHIGVGIDVYAVVHVSFIGM